MWIWEKWGEGLLEKGRVQHGIPLAIEMERRTDFLHTQVTGLGALQLGGQERSEKAVEGLPDEVRGLAQKVQIVAQAQGGGKVEELRSMVVDLNESMKSYGTQVEEKIALLGNHKKRELQERKSLGLELEGVRADAVGSTTMCEGLVHELANLRVSVETEFTTQAVASASR